MATENLEDVLSSERKIRNPFRVQREKENRKRRHKKRARLVVRNISYKANEKDLKALFAQWGPVEEFKLLKRPDGDLVGCGFVQYVSVIDANKAVKMGNKTEHLGRPLYIDWALCKNVYLNKIQGNKTKETKTIKDEHSGHEKRPTNRKKLTRSDKDEEEQGTEEDSGNEIGSSAMDEESELCEDENDSKKSGEEAENNSDLEFEGEQEDDECKPSRRNNEDIKKNVRKSNDVMEGCTVFLKNVPFGANDEDVKKCCQKFGLIQYAIVNRDSISGHSKGTAFVKFKMRESAESMLQPDTEIVLMDEVLQCFPALSRGHILEREKEKKLGKQKDSRNLYLAREGIIMSGSQAAIGVSAADMAKRHQLEMIKNQVLKNLNRFVSRNRLSIHNLPLSYDNEKLHQMVARETGFRPHECRVMRENKVTAEHPKGKSKGFGFVSFSTHNDAMLALRKLNNNPHIFGKDHRPIVGFSIEDRSVHNIKVKREQRSKLNNPTYKMKQDQKKAAQKKLLVSGKSSTNFNHNISVEPKALNSANQKINIKDNSRKASKKRAREVNGGEDKEERYFMGTTSKPGSNLRLRSVKKIREQAQEHLQTVRNEKTRLKKQKTHKFCKRIVNKCVNK